MKVLLCAGLAALTMMAVAEGPRATLPRRSPMGAMGAMGFNDPSVRFVSNPKNAEKLGLSAEQREKLTAIDAAFRKTARETNEKLRLAREKQRTLFSAEKIDEAEAMKAIEEISAVRCELEKNQMRRVIQIKALLTPEQIKKAAELAEEMRVSRRAARTRSPEPPKAEPAKEKNP